MQYTGARCGVLQMVKASFRLASVLAALVLAAPVFAQQAAPPVFDLGASQDGYLLGPGDRLNIKVFGSEEFSGVQLVLPDGTVNMPLIGAVPAVNQTVPELSALLERRLSAYVKKPRVAVRVEAFRPLRIAVSGEVLQPGPRQIQSLLTTGSTPNQTASTLPTLTSALAAAGGVSNQADVSQIRVSRRTSEGQVVEKRVDLWQTLEQGRTEEDILLKDGDAIFVPKVSPGSTIDSRLLARTTLAPGKIRVRIFGEVNKAGTQELDARATVVDAVASAGGLTNFAAPDAVEVASLEPDGRVTNRTINVNAAIAGDAAQNLQLRDQDAVIVRRSVGGEMLNALNVFAAPISTVANLFFIFRNFYRY